jgi:hypothetical protein
MGTEALFNATRVKGLEGLDSLVRHLRKLERPDRGRNGKVHMVISWIAMVIGLRCDEIVLQGKIRHEAVLKPYLP